MHLPAQLVNQVMALSPAARAELLALLHESLPAPGTPGANRSDDQLAAEWTEELDRRIAELRAALIAYSQIDAALVLAKADGRLEKAP